MEAPTHAELANKAIRGTRVKEFLEGPDGKAAVMIVRAQIHHEWLAATTVDAREKCHAKTLALDELLVTLTAMVQDGIVAEDTIERRAKRAAVDAAAEV